MTLPGEGALPLLFSPSVQKSYILHRTWARIPLFGASLENVNCEAANRHRKVWFAGITLENPNLAAQMLPIRLNCGQDFVILR